MKVTKLMAMALMATALSTNLCAQSPWTNNTQGKFFSFEFSRPSTSFFEDYDSFFSASYDLSLGLEVSENSELIIDLPIAHFNVNDSDLDFDAQTTIGNLYVGVRTGDRTKAVRGEFGALLPTAGDDNPYATFIGSLAYPNREEKYSPNLWGLLAKVRAEEVLNDKGLFYRLNGGLIYGNYSEDDFDATYLYLDYVGQIGVRSESGFSGVFGLSGRTALNEDSKYDEEDSSSFIAGIGVSYRSNNFEPGINLTLPLDDPFKEYIDNVINVSLLFHL